MKTEQQVIDETLQKCTEEHKAYVEVAIIKTGANHDCLGIVEIGSLRYEAEWFTFEGGHRALRVDVYAGRYGADTREYEPVNDSNKHHVERLANFFKNDWTDVRHDIRVLEGGSRIEFGTIANDYLFEKHETPPQTPAQDRPSSHA